MPAPIIGAVGGSLISGLFGQAQNNQNQQNQQNAQQQAEQYQQQQQQQAQQFLQQLRGQAMSSLNQYTANNPNPVNSWQAIQGPSQIGTPGGPVGGQTFSPPAGAAGTAGAVSPMAQQLLAAYAQSGGGNGMKAPSWGPNPNGGMGLLQSQNGSGSMAPPVVSTGIPGQPPVVGQTQPGMTTGTPPSQQRVTLPIARMNPVQLPVSGVPASPSQNRFLATPYQVAAQYNGSGAGTY